MKIILFALGLFLFVSALFIVSNENLHLRNDGEATSFLRIYYNWLIHFAGNMKDLTAYIVKFNWLPSREAPAINITK
jgi:hypothetical protein